MAISLISLGNSCKVREVIQRYQGTSSLETNMFDWVISNFDTVLYFMLNIYKPLIKDDFYDSKLHCLNHRRVHHGKILFESIHDVIFNNSYETEMNAFIDKYNRRLLRLKQLILSDKKIHFIHLVNFNGQNIDIPSVQNISIFNQLILQINPNCDYNLHILFPPQNCKLYKTIFEYNKTEIEKLSNKQVFIYFLSQNETDQPLTHQCLHWCWSIVFENIDKINK